MTTKDITNIKALVPVDVYPGEDVVEFSVGKMYGKTTFNDLFGGKLAVQLLEEFDSSVRVGYQCKDSKSLGIKHKGQYLVWTVDKKDLSFINIKPLT